MDELHARLIQICLAALAGGYAVQAHQIVNRLSDDVDLLMAFDQPMSVDQGARSPRAIP
ncbi:hypothetical protein HUT16_15500 [Kitasatospora sp. NA04385]|uniref:hypothetical protein n=1 Tax=Kitasatospora sp. NA04385 TaxID=2742135 RepID=UPI001591AAD6|nr:hypothetical protein [Kitasatospora sp. NA04385]QKW20285.1 hypothetical protein HUT16_15500 [Kitasatospora sp. NA04385]